MILTLFIYIVLYILKHENNQTTLQVKEINHNNEMIQLMWVFASLKKTPPTCAALNTTHNSCDGPAKQMTPYENIYIHIHESL